MAFPPGRRVRRGEGAWVGAPSTMPRSRLRRAVAAPVSALRRTARDPAMLRIQLAWATVMTASWAATITLTVVAYAAGGSVAVSLAVLARTVPGAIAGPMLGAIVDRGPRRRSMGWAAALAGVACAGAASAGGALGVVVVSMTVVAVATMLFRAAQSVVMPDLVQDPVELVSANVVSSAIEAVGLFAGPALAGLLLSWHGPSITFLVAAALFGVAALLLVCRLDEKQRARSHPAGSRPPSVRQLLRGGTARLLLSLVFAQTVVSGALVVLYAGLSVRTLDAGLSTVGLLTSAFGLGGVVGSLGLFALAGSSRLGVWTAGALALWAVPLALIPLVPSLTGVLGLLSVVGLGNVVFDVTVVTLLQRGVPASLVSRAFGVLETVVILGASLGAVTASPLERLVGPALAVGALGVFLVVVCLTCVPALRRLDTRLVAPTRQVALLRGLLPFGLLATPELERLALRLELVSVPAGHDVVVQGDVGDRYFVVDHGTLAVSVDGRVVATASEGEAFGEIALLHDRPRTATVTATTDARLWALEGRLFLAALSADGDRALAAADAEARMRLDRAAPRTSVAGDDGPGPV